MARRRKERTSGTKTGGRLKEAIVLIPMMYNDGTSVPRATLKAIREEIFERFQGWTIEGKVKGAYRMRTGRKRVEDLQKISIILQAARVPELEAMVARWGALLGQETMLLKLTDFLVKFVPPRAEEEQP